MDAVVKYVLEGHERGVNWAAFHPTQPLIVSGSDDRTIKLWRMSDTRAWEVDSMRGHNNNVSCVVYHPRHELIVSNSEDRSIRVWDANKRVLLHTYRREGDRFWILAAHPTRNLLAAGHDSGLSVFKLDRERPPFDSAGGDVLFVKDRYIRRAGLEAGGEGSPVVATRRYGGQFNFAARLRTLLANPFHAGAGHSVLVTTRADAGSWDMFSLPGPSGTAADPVHGSGLAAAFLSRNKFVTLDRATRNLQVRDFTGAVTKVVPAPNARADKLFQASTSGRVLVKSGDRVSLFEIASRRELNEVAGLVVKYVTWSADGEFVALQGKTGIVLATRNLTKLCAITEASRIKGGAWDANGVFVYTTVSHIKYVVAGPAGDRGVVRSLGVPLYPVAIADGVLTAFNRQHSLVKVKLDTTEYRFKIALGSRDYGEVLRIINTGRLAGAAVISYLRKAGFPEVALHFARDPRTRFALAVECGNLTAAEAAAGELDDPAAWKDLGQAALEQGDVELASTVLRRTGDAAQLAFLALITGRLGEVAAAGAKAATALAGGDKDAVMTAFSAALLTGDVPQRVRVLEAAGQIALAYTTATLHGLSEAADRLRGFLEEAGLPVPDVGAVAGGGPSPPALLGPPPALLSGTSWPRLAISQSVFDAAVAGGGAAGQEGGSAAAAAAAALDAAVAEAVDPDAWDDGLDLGLDGPGDRPAGGDTGAGGGADAAWPGGDLDLDLSEFDLPSGGEGGAGGVDGLGDLDVGDIFVAPTSGPPPAQVWVGNSTLAGDHAAAGAFASAAELLNRQLGIVNFTPLLPALRAAHQATSLSVPALPGLPGVAVPLHRGDVDGPPPGTAAQPRITVTLAGAMASLTSMYASFLRGKFADVARTCDTLFATLPLIVVATRKEETEVLAILKAAREYKTAVTLELARKGTAADTPEGLGRQVELAAYMTHCELEPAHMLLALNLAMTVAFKAKNFIHAAAFARRLLEVPGAAAPANAKLATKAKKVLALSEQQARNAITIDYDAKNPFDICCGSLTPIYRGSPLLRSPYSGAAYTPQFRGSVCAIDGMAAVGVETLGLVVRSAAQQG